MKTLIIFWVFAIFCIKFSYQRAFKDGSVFDGTENVKDKIQNVKNVVPPQLIRKKREIDLSSLELDGLGLDENTLKDLTGKIMDLLGGGGSDPADCEVIINNGDDGTVAVTKDDKPDKGATTPGAANTQGVTEGGANSGAEGGGDDVSESVKKTSVAVTKTDVGTQAAASTEGGPKPTQAVTEGGVKSTAAVTKGVSESATKGDQKTSAVMNGAKTTPSAVTEGGVTGGTDKTLPVTESGAKTTKAVTKGDKTKSTKETSAITEAAATEGGANPTAAVTNDAVTTKASEAATQKATTKKPKPTISNVTQKPTKQSPAAKTTTKRQCRPNMQLCF